LRLIVAGPERVPASHKATYIDHIVGDDAKADPTVHSGAARIATAVEAVSPLDDADAAVGSRAPLLAMAEPALLVT
jgi:hypothetical protein